MVDDHEEWEVQSIDEKRVRKGIAEFLVRWKGYGEHERTWEPLAHLGNAQDELLRWRASRPDKPSHKTQAAKQTKSATSTARENNLYDTQLRRSARVRNR
jgi:hypothetical protein